MDKLITLIVHGDESRLPALITSLKNKKCIFGVIKSLYFCSIVLGRMKNFLNLAPSYELRTTKTEA